MAAESILVVDDVPVNLKLTDILLRREGFEVHTTPDAEQALSLLRGFHPDLMLVDVELPGMDGLALARQVKQNPATRHIVVVALSGRASTGDNQRALDAGCEGYITKPVDSTTLVSSIRRHLERRPPRTAPPIPVSQPAPPPAAAPARTAAAETEDLETLQRRFLEEGALQCGQMLESLDKKFDAVKSARLFHQWVGAAGILGYKNISDLSRHAEEALNSGVLDKTCLREMFSNLIISFGEPQAVEQQHIPPSVQEALAGKPIGMVGFSADEAERVCSALELVHARPMLFRAADAPDGLSVRNCAAVMVQISAETLNTWWLAPNSPASAGQPLVLAGKREQILHVDGAVQARATEFLIDGWQPEEALMRLSFALSRNLQRPAGSAAHIEARPDPALRPVTEAPEILIADDDPTTRSMVRITLQEYGMECRLATDGAEALRMIRAHRPHAAVLDVNMPQMDGYLVLAAVRDEKLPVRVVLLTARKHENDISRGFTLGADDYIVKPFNAVELVARLKRLLRR
jgi:two-component system, cell cycle response regulator DivK